MAITTIQGVGGNIALPTGFNGKHFQWNATFNFNVVETTGFADLGWRTRSITYADVTGTATSIPQFDAATTSPINATLIGSTLVPASGKGSMTLTHTTGCTHAFTGVIGSVAFNRPFDGREEATYTFSSDGAVTQVWDETP